MNISYHLQQGKEQLHTEQWKIKPALQHHQPVEMVWQLKEEILVMHQSLYLLSKPMQQKNSAKPADLIKIKLMQRRLLFINHFIEYKMCNIQEVPVPEARSFSPKLMLEEELYF